MIIKIFGREIKLNPIREDLAIHDFYLGYVNYAIITFATLHSILTGIIACGILAIIWGILELYQWKSKTGTGSITDWLVSCRSILMMLTILIIFYTKYN